MYSKSIFNHVLAQWGTIYEECASGNVTWVTDSDPKPCQGTWHLTYPKVGTVPPQKVWTHILSWTFYHI